MQIDINAAVLETMLTHATTAARFASYIDGPIVVDGFIVVNELDKSLQAIIRMLADLLGKPYEPQPIGESTKDVESEFDVANSVDVLRQLVARASAIANAAERLFDEVAWVRDEGDGDQFEHLAHLVSATTDAVEAAKKIGNKLGLKLSTRRPGA